MFMHRKLALIRFRLLLIQDMKVWVSNSVCIHGQIVDRFMKEKQRRLERQVVIPS